MAATITDMKAAPILEQRVLESHSKSMHQEGTHVSSRVRLGMVERVEGDEQRTGERGKVEAFAQA